jgi:hypothetical protein
MIVKCIANAKEALDRQFWSDVDDYLHQERANLVVGNTYTVFGLAFRGDRVWYLVCEDPDDGFPVLHLGAFFEPVDLRLPVGWALSLEPNNLGAGASLLPERWASDPTFMERLVDGTEDDHAYFHSLKASL